MNTQQFYRQIALLICFSIRICYTQHVVVLNEHYTYSIENPENYTTLVSIEGMNVDESPHTFSVPLSELSTLESSNAQERKKGKWKNSRIDQTVTISSIDYSSFFSGYKYLKYEIPPLSHFRLNLTFREKHSIFLSEMNKTGNYGTAIFVKYDYHLPDNLQMSTSNGKKFSGKVSFTRDDLDSLNSTFFLIHPDNTSPSDYFSGWFSERIIPQVQISKTRVPEVLDDLRKTTNDSVFASACFEFVQKEIRYVAIENGINAIIPRHCEKTLQSGLGDCKDMATLLTAIYRYYGFEAYLAISQTNAYDFPFSFPSLGMANHMICVLKLDEKWYYLDPTENGCLFGDPSMQTFGTNAFLIDHAPEYFLSIPKTPRHLPYGQFSYEIDSKNMLVRLKVETKGKMNLLFNYMAYNYKSPKEHIEKLFLKKSQNNWEVDSLDISLKSSLIYLSTPLKKSMKSILKDQTLYDPSAFMLSLQDIISIFHNGNFPRFNGQVTINVKFEGNFTPAYLMKYPSDIFNKKNALHIALPIVAHEKSENFYEDSAYALWQEIIANPIPITHEN